MLAMNRELEDAYKLSVRSTPEVFEAFHSLVALVFRDRSVRFVGKAEGKTKRPTRAAVLNALMLFFDLLPNAEKKRCLVIGMDRLNRLLRGERIDQDELPPPDWRPGSARTFEGPAPAPSESSQPHGEQPVTRQKRPRRRRGRD